jgi:hypothetical protein
MSQVYLDVNQNRQLSRSCQDPDIANMSPNVLDSVDEKNGLSAVDAGNKDTEAYGGKGETTELHHVTLHEADEAAAFVSGFQGEIDPIEAKRVLRKIDWNLLPLM